MISYISWRSNLKSRDVEVAVSATEWKRIWTDSGKWNQRGARPQDYCIERKDRSKPATADNLQVTSVATLYSRHAQDKQQLLDALAEIGYERCAVENTAQAKKKTRRQQK
jgi:hypothetical protein